jgi:hypothetical protein
MGKRHVRRKQTCPGDAELPQEMAAITEDLFRRDLRFRDIPVRAENDIGHKLKMPQVAAYSTKIYFK